MNVKAAPIPEWLRNVIVLLVATACVIAAVIAVDQVRHRDVPGSLTSTVRGTGVEVGSPAPSFTATDLDGMPFDFEERGGRPAWLVFNATWCTACRIEAPDIQALHEEFGDEVTIIGVYVDDSTEGVREWGRTLGLTYTQIADADSSIGQAYDVLGLPAHVFVDAQGMVASVSTGVLSPEQMRDRLEAIGVG